MAKGNPVQLDKHLAGPNLAYVLDAYERYLKDPESVSEDFQQFFAVWSPPADDAMDTSTQTESLDALANDGMRQQKVGDLSDEFIQQVRQAQQLVQDIRAYGHLAADTNPLVEPGDIAGVYGSKERLSDDNLRRIPARWVWPEAPADVSRAFDAIERLKHIYTGHIAFDFAHVHDEQEQNWLLQKAESGELSNLLDDDDRRELLQKLIEVDEFERFLQRTFVGQKRFSIEGLDMLVPMLSRFVSQAMETGAANIMIGMAHRGRLNTLAHILGKPYETIFSEFHTSVNKDLVPSEGSIGINYGWSGDVKYHLGAKRSVEDNGAREARLVLANNPSHLEFVDPVVEGFTRAAQDDRAKAGPPVQEVKTALAILVHGDAAFPGEGIVAETLNLSNLAGYDTGGTIHVIANNQLGFTATTSEGRSTRYASDLARGFEIPIVHVSADDPEACMQAVALAMAYRLKFHKDFLIDLIGYRRWGHNEMDDPVPTQPKMYESIKNHAPVRDIYSKQLEASGLVGKDVVKHMENEMQEKLKSAYEGLKQTQAHGNNGEETKVVDKLPNSNDTGVSSEALDNANDAVLKGKADFTVYGKLQRLLERRNTAFHEDKIDWAHAEELAFATILMDGTPIRMTGQDSERGTFSQRHLVLHDEQTGQRDCPLQRLPQAKASFAIHNSPLSEAGVLGFEYGYDVQAGETLVIWEAQFGDFANAGQVIIDQFLASGRAKWKQPSGLVLLLPHGYEGQGPEHSSARLERYLQLSAETNWRVVYPTTAAQYFHLLRTQAQLLGTSARPLIVMTPKSLLRNPRVTCSRSDLVDGRFEPVLWDRTFTGKKESIQRVVLCSGKVALDFETFLADSNRDASSWLTMARVEQLYPFPEQELQQVMESFPNVKEVVWLQEEPANMGAWSYIQPRLEQLLPAHVSLIYRGRGEHASPAEGSADVHQERQNQLLHSAIERADVTVDRNGGNSNE